KHRVDLADRPLPFRQQAQHLQAPFVGQCLQQPCRVAGMRPHRLHVEGNPSRLHGFRLLRRHRHSMLTDRPALRHASKPPASEHTSVKPNCRRLSAASADLPPVRQYSTTRRDGTAKASSATQPIAGCAWIWNSSTPRGKLIAPARWPCAYSPGSRTSTSTRSPMSVSTNSSKEISRILERASATKSSTVRDIAVFQQH